MEERDDKLLSVMLEDIRSVGKKIDDLIKLNSDEHRKISSSLSKHEARLNEHEKSIDVLFSKNSKLIWAYISLLVSLILLIVGLLAKG